MRLFDGSELGKTGWRNPEFHAAARMIVPATPDNIAEAGKRLKNRGWSRFNQTVYGLGADATSDIAVARIFAAKNRPDFNPLIVHVPDLNTAATLAEFTDLGQKIAETFWPGPMSLVLRKSDCPVSHLAAAGLETTPYASRHGAGNSGCPSGRCGTKRQCVGKISPTEAAHVRVRETRSIVLSTTVPAWSVWIHCGRLHVKHQLF